MRFSVEQIRIGIEIPGLTRVILADGPIAAQEQYNNNVPAHPECTSLCVSFLPDVLGEKIESCDHCGTCSHVGEDWLQDCGWSLETHPHRLILCPECRLLEYHPCSVCGGNSLIEKTNISASWHLCDYCEGSEEAEIAGYTHN